MRFFHIIRFTVFSLNVSGSMTTQFKSPATRASQIAVKELWAGAVRRQLLEPSDQEAHTLHLRSSRCAWSLTGLNYRHSQRNPSVNEILRWHRDSIGSGGLRGAHAVGRNGAQRMAVPCHELDLAGVNRTGLHQQPSRLPPVQCVRQGERHFTSLNGLLRRRWGRRRSLQRDQRENESRGNEKHGSA